MWSNRNAWGLKTITLTGSGQGISFTVRPKSFRFLAAPSPQPISWTTESTSGRVAGAAKSTESLVRRKTKSVLVNGWKSSGKWMLRMLCEVRKMNWSSGKNWQWNRKRNRNRNRNSEATGTGSKAVQRASSAKGKQCQKYWNTFNEKVRRGRGGVETRWKRSMWNVDEAIEQTEQSWCDFCVNNNNKSNENNNNNNNNKWSTAQHWLRFNASYGWIDEYN